MHIIMGDSYFSYKEALAYVNLAMLDVRREKLCLKFARKAVKNRKHNKWFKPNKASKTRQKQEKYCSAVARTDRLLKGPICYLTNLLNKNENTK